MLGYPILLKQFYPAPAQNSETLETPTDEPVEAGKGVFFNAPKSAAVPEKEPQKILFENEVYEAEFSTLGGSISRLVYKGEIGRQAATRNVLFEGVPLSPGILTAKISGDPLDLSLVNFEIVSPADSRDGVTLQYENPGQYRIVKQFVLSRSEAIMGLTIKLENLGTETRNYPLEIEAGLHSDTLVNQPSPHEFSVVAWNGKVAAAEMKHVSKKGFQVSGDVDWAGVIKKYFVILLKPEWKILSAEGRADAPSLWSRVRMEPLTLAAGGMVQKEIFIYAGPQRYETLADFKANFENILSRGFFGPLKIIFLKALKASHQFTHNFGWDIIILTVLIKLLFSPLTHMSYKSMEKMKIVQPRVKSLQERFKNDPARMNKEMMELYKRNRVNPMGGCLPMLLQIPIFIAFYQVLSEAIELRGAPFVGWIQNLAEPDRLFMLPFSLPLLGDSFNLLPLFMIASMVVQQKMTPQSGVTPEQQKIFAFMPLIFGFIFYKMPSGLVLYWFLNNVLSIIQQGFVQRIKVTLHHEDRDHS